MNLHTNPYNGVKDSKNIHTNPYTLKNATCIGQNAKCIKLSNGSSNHEKLYSIMVCMEVLTGIYTVIRVCMEVFTIFYTVIRVCACT